MMEVMGLHLPGAAFENPDTPLRKALTVAAVQRATEITALGQNYIPVGRMIDERSIVNAIVGLLATGGSTNHTMHLVAIARAAAIHIDWNDFDELSAIVPLVTCMYPNGVADVNHFHAAGGMAFVIRELLDAGLLHDDVQTIMGPGLGAYAKMPVLDSSDRIAWQPARAQSGDTSVLRPATEPFSTEGGLKVLDGNLGRAVIKISSVKRELRLVEAPARVFETQHALIAAAKAGELDRDVVAVVRFQGPRANGMPELHQLTPTLANIQDKGFRVALVTDGRMSGASGKIPAAIHVSPEALAGGALALIRDGDIIRVDPANGVLELKVPAQELATRQPASFNPGDAVFGVGRELFGGFRSLVTIAEEGASSLPFED
jgi:phosphogluconate dehydratase